MKQWSEDRPGNEKALASEEFLASLRQLGVPACLQQADRFAVEVS
jgi:hypothetical protein